MNYYCHFLFKLKELEHLGAKVFCIGRSTLGRPIFCVRIGSGEKKLVVQSSIHAREHITCQLSFLLLKHLLKEELCGRVFFIPLSNPDGVCLAKEGLASLNKLDEEQKLCQKLFAFCQEQKISKLFVNALKKKLFAINNFSQDFSLWKANINCVDLNVNFDAKWKSGKLNKLVPASENYVGPCPLSENETKALANFVCALKPHMTISYHSKGEVIFYDFHQKGKQKKRDKKFATEISKLTGYKIKKTGKSAGGFKDYCIQKLKIPSLTIEVGKESFCHPILPNCLPLIYSQNKKVIQKSLALLNEINV